MGFFVSAKIGIFEQRVGYKEILIFNFRGTYETSIEMYLTILSG